MPLASSSATILTIGVTSSTQSLMRLRDLVDTAVVPRLLGVQGVADVNVFGGDVRQVQIQLRPERLHLFDVSVADVVAAARSATSTRGTGFVENSNQRLTIEVAGTTQPTATLGDVIVARRDDGNIRLADVANIAYGPAPAVGAASIMGQPAVLMMVIGQYGANTLSVSRDTEAVLSSMEKVLAEQGVTMHPGLFRPANYIEQSLSNIGGHLLIGAAFVIIVLFLFLFNIRTAFISTLAIPLSLLGAVIILLQKGVNLNIMVLGGLAIALGEVVDDAIIDTENIFRRMRENRRLGSPRPLADVVFRASMEVRGSVVYASFIVALVFVPLLTLGGVAGRLFAPLGYTYILAVLVSLLVALTVTPALCLLLLGSGRFRPGDPPLVSALIPHYSRLLLPICRAPVVTLAITLLLCAAGVAMLPSVQTKFLPDLREGHYIVHTTSVPGTSLAESIRIGNRLSAMFASIPGVRSVSQWAGRAERGADTFGSHYSEYEVDLNPLSGGEQHAILEALRRILRGFPGILYEANTFLIERVDETVSGYTAPVVVNIYGGNLDALDGVARQVAEILRSTAGAEAVQIRSPAGAPYVSIRFRPGQLALYGITRQDVVDVLAVAFDGGRVGQVQIDDRLVDITVLLPQTLRRQASTISELPVRSADGVLVDLGRVLDVSQSGGRYNILHRSGQRLQTVTCHVSNRDLQSFMAEIRQRILSEVHFPEGTSPEFAGAAIERAKARNALVLHSLLVGSLVFLLVLMAVGSFRHALLILVNLPFSLVGGVVAVVLTGATLSVGSLVGFVTLFGITVRNSIMLVSHYRHLVERENCKWGLDTAVRGARERLPSIVMTAMVTALAMLPIAINSDNPGREIMGPMAAIIIGGLLSSTILNLLVMPSIMLRFGRFTRVQPEPGG